ncbi:MAG: hypothetical protein R3A52_30395 [Polyangiales bacterium]
MIAAWEQPDLAAVGAWKRGLDPRRPRDGPPAAVESFLSQPAGEATPLAETVAGCARRVAP